MNSGDRVRINGWPTVMTVVKPPASEDPHEEVELLIAKYNRVVRCEFGHLKNGEVKYEEI
jgi:hypothetical protein